MDKGRIAIRQAGVSGTPPPLLLVIDLDGVYVRGVEAENRTSEPRPAERVTLAFEHIVCTYTPMSPTGTPLTKIAYEYTVA